LLSVNLPLRILLEWYGIVIRSVPELLIIFLLYFGGSFALGRFLSLFNIETYIEVSAFWAGALALGLIQAGYTSEVFRGAILAVPPGLIEAAKSLGMGRQTFRLVTLPLALRYALPGLCNMWMVVIKHTPFVSAIGLEDLIRTAGTAGENTKQFIAFYATVVIAYLAISAATLFIQSVFERRIYRHIEPPRNL
jgi:ABC-type arginine transport system permease subunit